MQLQYRVKQRKLQICEAARQLSSSVQLQRVTQRHDGHKGMLYPAVLVQFCRCIVCACSATAPAQAIKRHSNRVQALLSAHSCKAHRHTPSVSSRAAAASKALDADTTSAAGSMDVVSTLDTQVYLNTIQNTGIMLTNKSWRERSQAATQQILARLAILNLDSGFIRVLCGDAAAAAAAGKGAGGLCCRQGTA